MDKLQFNISFLFVLVISCCLLAPTFTLAEETSSIRRFDKKNWQEATKDMDYQPIEKKKKKEKKDKEQPDFNLEALKPILKVLMWIIVIGGLCILIFFLVKEASNLSVNKKINTQVDFDTLEDNIEDADLDQALEHTLESKDYINAIRVAYLQVLQELNNKTFIQYKRDKTNRNYRNELQERRPSLVAGFKSTTTIFEKVRYSNSQLDSVLYEEIRTIIDTYLSTIKETA